MTEQEKQAYIEQIKFRLELQNGLNLCNGIERIHQKEQWSPFKQDEKDIKFLLNALDERDREVESLRQLLDLLCEHKKAYYKYGKRLRKALEEIADYDKQHTVKATAIFDVAKVARQALAGEEKG
jgi:hypothetical protein